MSISLAVALQVLLSGNAKIYATADAAKAAKDTKQTAAGSHVVTIVEEQGDIIKVSTAAGHDCAETFMTGIEVTGYVRKSALVPRLAKEIKATFADGTGYVVDVGAPVIGGKVADPVLAVLAGAVTETVLGVAAHDATTLDPVLAWADMRCEHGPQTDDEYTAWHAKQPPSKRREAKEGDLPYLGDPPGRACDPVAGSMSINGTKLALKTPELSSVYQRAKGDYRVDIGGTCVELRVATKKLKPGRKAILNMSEFGGGVPYDFEPGPLTWPDGSPAGEMTVGVPFDAKFVKQKGDLLCITYAPLAQPVCRTGDSAHRLPR